jgi:MFS family permease
MSKSTVGAAQSGSKDQLLFWGCFVALVTTAFGFIARMFLIGTWEKEFGLDPAESGRLAGIGIWPFAVSIIGFSLVIDKVGYKIAMFAAFFGHLLWAVMGVSAYYISKGGNKELAYSLLYWGSLILGLANGTIEAFINPVVATMFSKEKTKWLNILHAGWPGGLVVAGMLTIFLDFLPWSVKVGMLAVPAVIYFLMLAPLKFPVQEREAAGVSYKEMLAEFGVLGALVVGFLVTLQLLDFFPDSNQYIFIGIGVAIVVGFGVYTQALGRMLMFFMVLIMMPLATTEIGTDGWITKIMEGVAEGNFHPGWILVYTSAIMMVLRFFAGPIVHSLSPLGLLAASAILAIAGLFMLSSATGAMIFVAATLYGFGKTFFWPTTLGVVAEQTPRGGALTLNAISGIGMLAVGTLGFPYIGTLQSAKNIDALVASDAAQSLALVQDGKLAAVTEKSIYKIIPYSAVDQAKIDAAIAAKPAAEQDKLKEDVKTAVDRSNQKALGNMAAFPGVMLIGYLALILYFRSQGGYKAEVLVGHAAQDDKFTGGVTGPADA